MRIHLDFETRSKAKIGTVGTVRYCQDESTEPVMLAIARDDEEPVVWSPEWLRGYGQHDPEAEELLDRLRHLEEGDEVHAFNYLFEHSILLYKFGIDVPTKHWRCTQILGRIAGYPESLQELCNMLGFQDGKIEAGSALLNYFCSPISSGKKKGEFRDPTIDALRWWELTEYCMQDVRVERECYHLLKRFWPKGVAQKAFWLTHVMNMRGVPINQKAMRHAQEQLDLAVSHHSAEFEARVGVRPTQRDKCLAWFQEKGYPYSSLDKEHVALATEEETLSEEVKELLVLRSEIVPAAVKKLKKMEAMMCEDGTVKGVMSFCGAQQTWRWSSRGLQVQNMKRPNKLAADFFTALRDGASWEDLEAVYGSYPTNLSYAIRCFIGTFPGLSVADYSQIEARITAWIAGQDDLVDAFANGRKVYEMMAAFVFDMDEDDIAKDSFERHVGKELVLGAGFGMGHDKFADRAGCALDLAERAIRGYREKNYRIPQLWKRLDRAAFKAIRNPGKEVKVNVGPNVPEGLPEIKYWFGRMHDLTNGEPTNYLVCTLPSGRHIYYLRPEIKEEMKPWGEKGPVISYLSRDLKTGKMVRRSIWYGVLIENIVQAIAADLMMYGTLCAWRAGFDVRMLVHDEAVTNRIGAHMERNHARLIEELVKLPKWAKGLPLAAEGDDVPFYYK